MHANVIDGLSKSDCFIRVLIHPGALLKTAFICSNIIDFPSSTSLVQQLKEKFGSGFQLHSIANLPQGSGMYIAKSKVYDYNEVFVMYRVRYQ